MLKLPSYFMGSFLIYIKDTFLFWWTPTSLMLKLLSSLISSYLIYVKPSVAFNCPL